MVSLCAPILLAFFGPRFFRTLYIIKKPRAGPGLFHIGNYFISYRNFKKLKSECTARVRLFSTVVGLSSFPCWLQRVQVVPLAAVQVEDAGVLSGSVQRDLPPPTFHFNVSSPSSSGEETSFASDHSSCHSAHKARSSADGEREKEAKTLGAAHHGVG